MSLVFIGKIVNTHGLNGELKIRSDINYKDLVFKDGFKIYIGDIKEEKEIIGYRKHQVYDMVLLDGINDIDKAIKYKNKDVYINRDDLEIDGYINTDLIGMSVYSNNVLIGKVDEIINNGAHDIIVIGKNMIPLVLEFIKNVDLDNKRIDVELIEGMLNED